MQNSKSHSQSSQNLGSKESYKATSCTPQVTFRQKLLMGYRITLSINTIVYIVPTDSDLGRVMKKSKIGVVWHTTYSGSTLPDMKASFGVNISKLSKTSSVWMDDATYKDVSGRATFTATKHLQSLKYYHKSVLRLEE